MSWRATTRRNRTYNVTILSVREDSAPSPRRTDRSSKPAETSKGLPLPSGAASESDRPCRSRRRPFSTPRISRSIRSDSSLHQKGTTERVLTHPIVVSERLPPTHKQHPPSYSTLQASLRCSIINVLTARGITPRALPHNGRGSDPKTCSHLAAKLSCREKVCKTSYVSGEARQDLRAAVRW